VRGEERDTAKPSAKKKEVRRKAESRNRALYKALCVY
jgi:hypothetical protein